MSTGSSAGTESLASRTGRNIRVRHYVPDCLHQINAQFIYCPYIGEWIDGLRHGWGRSTWCSHASSAGTNSGTSNYATPWEFINPLGDIEPANNGAGMTGHASAGALQEQLGDVALSALREHGCIVQETYEGGHAGGFREGAGCFHRLVFTLNRDSGAVSCECEAYEGHWRAGQQHGWGAMTYTNGSVSSARRFD